MNTKWATTIGSSTAVKFPVGVGAKGNEGVGANILQLNGTIGYIEYAYAKSNNISIISEEDYTLHKINEIFLNFLHIIYKFV